MKVKANDDSSRAISVGSRKKFHFRLERCFVPFGLLKNILASKSLKLVYEFRNLDERFQTAVD